MTFSEDAKRLKSNSFIVLGVGVVLCLIAMLLLQGFPRNTGYIEAGLGGGLLGGGIIMAILAVKSIIRDPRILLEANEQGIAICLGEEGLHTICWGEIKGITAKAKGVNKGVAIELADEAAYQNRLNAKQQKVAKQNKQIFGTAASVSTTACITSNDQIVQQLNNYRQSLAS